VAGVFGSKPSDAHVIWRTGRDDDGKKKFDFEYLRLWAAHFGVDYEQWTRTDHERSDEPRVQHACVFNWATTGGQEITIGDSNWSMGRQRKPRTFVEIDEAGVARIKGWSAEAILDVSELVVDGTTFDLQTVDGAVKTLDATALADSPEDDAG
jgi:hypothetical protein